MMPMTLQCPKCDVKITADDEDDLVRQVTAQKISSGILVLDDNGVYGVRVVNHGIVRFMPVQIVSDDPDGMWVSGLPDHVTVITVGQQFVNDGARVVPVETGAHA